MKMTRKRLIIAGLIAFLLGFAIAFITPGATLQLTNCDGTILPPPAWGEYITNQDKVGANCFTYDISGQYFWLIGASNWLDEDGGIVDRSKVRNFHKS